MLGASPLVVAAVVLWWHPVSGSPVTTTATLICPENETPVDARVSYRVWSSVSVRLAESSYTDPCAVNVPMAYEQSLQMHDGQLSPPLLLVKIDQLQLTARDDSFHVMMSNPSRGSKPYDCPVMCGATYLWANESVLLRFFAKNPPRALPLYEASIFVTEAINVCGNESHSHELLVESNSKFVFAPDVRHEKLPPNNVRCSPGTLYFVSVRPSVASAALTITALACPSNDSCSILQISGQNCSDGMTVKIPPPGANATLNFLYRNCKDPRKFAGFTMSAHAHTVEPSSTPASITPSLPANTVSAAMTTKSSIRTVHSTRASSTGSSVVAATGSRSAVATSKAGSTAADAESSQQTSPTSDASATKSTTGASVAVLVPVTAGSGFPEHDATSPLNLTAIAASGGTLAVVAALVTGVTIALLYRRRRSRRSPFRKQTSNVIPGARRSASDSKEHIPMVDNDLYGESLASKTTTNQ